MDKLNLILDLDQTLLSAESPEKNIPNKDRYVVHDMMNLYHIIERPGLQSFLDYIFENYNVSVWTAASKEYATYVIEHIILQNKKERELKWVLFSYHCELSNSLTSCDKDISLLWRTFNIDLFNSSNTVMIDDNDDIWKHQPNRVIHIPGFWPERDTFTDNKLLLNISYLEKIKKNPSKLEHYVKKINDLFKNDNI